MSAIMTVPEFLDKFSESGEPIVMRGREVTEMLAEKFDSYLLHPDAYIEVSAIPHENTVEIVLRSVIPDSWSQ